MNLQPFLDTIIERPDEDGPRLIFADFLEENGKTDRAELIRVQLKWQGVDRVTPCLEWQQVRIDGQQWNCRCEQCRKAMEWRRDVVREQELLERILPANPNPIQYTYVRGMIEAIVCSWEDWVKNHETLRKHCPLRNVKLTTNASVWYVEGFQDYVEATVLKGDAPIRIDRKAWGIPSNPKPYLEARWKGIEFELHPAPIRYPLEWREPIPRLVLAVPFGTVQSSSPTAHQLLAGTPLRRRDDGTYEEDR